MCQNPTLSLLPILQNLMVSTCTLQASMQTMLNQGDSRQHQRTPNWQTNHGKPRRWQATAPHYRQANQGGGRQHHHTTSRQTNHERPRRWQTTAPHYRQPNQSCKTKEVAGNITTLQAGKPTMKSQGGGRQQPHYTGRQTNDVKPRRWQATSLHYRQANQP